MISKDGRMKIRISESRFKQIVREELAIAKLQRRLREDAPTQPAGTQQASKPVGDQAVSDTARRKKQYTCRCGAKFMDYEGIKGAPLCPKCNDAEVKATGQQAQGAVK
jgi:hypothetical protein